MIYSFIAIIIAAMKNILVPTDFSMTAKNAALYALNLAKQIGAKKIILYNVYQTSVSVVGDPMIPALGVLDIESIKETSEESLDSFRKEIEPFADNIEIDTLSEFNLLAEGIHTVCQREKIDLIVMGITGGGAVKENLFGSNTINVARQTTTPVIIVPPEKTFTPVRNVMFACDFNKVTENTPANSIKKLLDATHAKLYVFNAGHSHRNQTEIAHESEQLDKLFENYDLDYHFSTHPDFTVCINKFALEKEIDIIILIPKKHDFFDAIFKKSHTKMMAFHSHVPLMVMHS